MVIARASIAGAVRWDPPSKKSPYESRSLGRADLAAARLGFIHNPRSGQNRRRPYRLSDYRDALGDRALVRETREAGELGATMREFHAAGVNTIVVNGGDGSLATAVTEAYYHYGEADLPAFVPLCGGSFNAVARNIGCPHMRRLELLRTLRDVLAGGGRGLREKLVGSMRLHDPRSACDRFGFVLMAGIPYKLDEYIYATGGTEESNSLVCLANMLVGGLLGTKLGKRIFTDTPARITVDGQDCGCSSFKLTVATTVHRLLPLVAPCPPPPAASQRRFSYLVNYMPTRELFKRPVQLFLNKVHDDPKHRTGHARALILHGHRAGYSLDGEMVRSSEDVDLSIADGVPVRMWVMSPPDPFVD